MLQCWWPYSKTIKACSCRRYSDITGRRATNYIFGFQWHLKRTTPKAIFFFKILWKLYFVNSNYCFCKQKAFRDGSGPDGQLSTTFSDIGGLVFGIILAADQKGSYTLKPSALSHITSHQVNLYSIIWLFSKYKVTINSLDITKSLMNCGFWSFSMNPTFLNLIGLRWVKPLFHLVRIVH